MARLISIDKGWVLGLLVIMACGCSPAANPSADNTSMRTVHADSKSLKGLNEFAIRIYATDNAKKQGSVGALAIQSHLDRRFDAANIRDEFGVRLPLFMGDGRDWGHDGVDIPAFCLVIDYSYEFYRVRALLMDQRQVIWTSNEIGASSFEEARDIVLDEFVEDWKNQNS